MRMIITSRAPRIDGPRDCDPESRASLGSSARRALPVLRIVKLLPLRGKPASLVVETAAGLAFGGSAENTAPRTIDGSPAIARASGVADGFSGYSTICRAGGRRRDGQRRERERSRAPSPDRADAGHRRLLGLRETAPGIPTRARRPGAPVRRRTACTIACTVRGRTGAAGTARAAGKHRGCPDWFRCLLVCLPASLFAAPACAQAPPSPPARASPDSTWAASRVDAAAARIEAAFGPRLRSTLEVRVGGHHLHLTSRGGGLALDARASAERALATGGDVKPVVTARLDKFLDRLERAGTREPRDAKLRYTVTKLKVARARDGLRLDRDAARDACRPRSPTPHRRASSASRCATSSPT